MDTLDAALAALIQQGPTVAALVAAIVWVDRRILPLWTTTTETLARASDVLERACDLLPKVPKP